MIFKILKINENYKVNIQNYFNYFDIIFKKINNSIKHNKIIYFLRNIIMSVN